jgi:hypothetical protein
MHKDKQSFKVWAVHDGRRTLMHVIEEPGGRQRAMKAIEQLKTRPEIEAIELREHIVSFGGDPESTPRAHRGTLRWQRSGEGWRQVGH